MGNEDIFKFKAYWQVIENITGYNFSGYSLESLNCRLENFISSESIGSPEELKDKAFSRKASDKYILKNLLVSYTEMFRDPDFFLSLKNNVLPHFLNYPEIRIWHIGCASGEEVVKNSKATRQTLLGRDIHLENLQAEEDIKKIESRRKKEKKLLKTP